ncbi:ATP-binding cassette domain-containing protein [Mesorhizobium sp. 2RAF21]|jgi:glycine betaine/proline transport system ATP-binding protein|uniref:ATP-binding cassette domain-containing protein n=1 Tax=Mesorhizobium sp. 2RAF21 TaxID=3232995 RepID=UPI003F9D1986
MAGSMITCENVWKVYGPPYVPGEEPTDAHVVALKAANFTIKKGECFVIMGLSGSGKSTLVRCLTRLIEPSEGRINVADNDVTGASPKQLMEIRRKVMGMVFQNFALLPHLTVLENVAFPLSVRGVDMKTRTSKARELVKTVGLAGRENHFPSELSGGQQQRVGIARALSSEPEVLFMDEPFSALDPLLRRELQDEFIRLRHELKKTVVFITHDFDEAIRLADRIAIMRNGEILEIGTPEQLVIHSKHPYVTEFTRHCDRSSVLRARTLARPLRANFEPSVSVDGNELVADVAAKVLGGREDAGVLVDGKLTGILTKGDVIASLTGKPIELEAV